MKTSHATTHFPHLFINDLTIFCTGFVMLIMTGIYYHVRHQKEQLTVTQKIEKLCPSLGRKFNLRGRAASDGCELATTSGNVALIVKAEDIMSIEENTP